MASSRTSIGLYCEYNMGGLCYDSSGNIYVIGCSNWSASEAYIKKSTDGGQTFNTVGTINGSGIGWPGGSHPSYITATIDGNNVIHILCADTTPHMAYNTFDTSNNSFGTWYYGFTKVDSMFAIGCDENNKPHIVCSPSSDYVVYANKTGADWSSWENVSTASSIYWRFTSISVVDSTHIYFSYYQSSEKKIYKRAKISGSFGSETSWTNTTQLSYGNRHAGYDGTIYYQGANNVDGGPGSMFVDDTLLDNNTMGHGTSYFANAITVVGDTLIAFFTNSSDYLAYYYKKIGGNWQGPVQLQGNYYVRGCVTVQSYRYNNQTTQVGVWYRQTGTPGGGYFEYFNAPGFETSSAHAYLRGMTSTSSSKPANVQSGTMVRGSKPCYIFAAGEDLVPDSDIANQTGWVNEADGSTLFTSLADSSDATFVKKVVGQVGDYFEVGLSDVQFTPISTAHHLIIWRFEQTTGVNMVIKIELRQNTTVIATDQVTLSGTMTEHMSVLTQAEVNNISDYSALRFRVTIVSIP